MYDIIVVGGGPAGLTAALYAARAGRKVLVFEKENPGGQILYAPLVENYPGVPGISGARYAEELSQQVEQLGVTFSYAAVNSFSPADGGYCVESDEGKFCRALILAPGASHRTLGLPGEEDLVGLGVSYCAICDGPFYAGKHVAVVGGGDTALQDAIFLSEICDQVTLIHRRQQFRGEAHMVRRVKGKNNIRLRLGYVPQSILLDSEENFQGLQIAPADGGESEQLQLDGVFVAVGRQPGTAPFADRVLVDAAGYFLVGEDCATDLPGVFVAGDCRKKAVRQLTTAVSDGAVAGLAAAAYVEGVVEAHC